MTLTAPLPMLRKPNKQVGLRVHSSEWREVRELARQHDLKVGEVVRLALQFRLEPLRGRLVEWDARR